MFEHVFFIYLNCFLRIIFVRMIIFLLFYLYRIRVLVFWNLPCPHVLPCRILVVVVVSVLPNTYHIIPGNDISSTYTTNKMIPA